MDRLAALVRRRSGGLCHLSGVGRGAHLRRLDLVLAFALSGRRSAALPAVDPRSIAGRTADGGGNLSVPGEQELPERLPARRTGGNAAILLRGDYRADAGAARIRGGWLPSHVHHLVRWSGGGLQLLRDVLSDDRRVSQRWSAFAISLLIHSCRPTSIAAKNVARRSRCSSQ